MPRGIERSAAASSSPPLDTGLSVLGGILLTPTLQCRSWKSKQAEEIARREEESARKKEEAIVKAQNAIDNFYKEYNAKKEKNIAKNKCVDLQRLD